MARRIFAHLILFIGAFYLLGPGTDAHASGPPLPGDKNSIARIPYRPDLYLDPDALLTHVIPGILQNTRPETRISRQMIPFLRVALFSGTPYFPPSYGPRRELLDWMVEKPYHSISLPVFLQKTIEIEGGDVQRALQLGWDVLRENYTYVEARNLFPHILRLEDITGELQIFAGQVRGGRISMRGDNFSAWYHFFGTALSAFYSGSIAVFPITGKLETMAMITLEERILHNDQIDPLKRREIDKAGARFGAGLVAALRKFRTLEEYQRQNPAPARPYLVERPDIYGDKWRLKPGQNPHDFGTGFASGERPGAMLDVHHPERFFLDPNRFASWSDYFDQIVGHLLEPKYRERTIAILRSIENPTRFREEFRARLDVDRWRSNPTGESLPHFFSGLEMAHLRGLLATGDSSDLPFLSAVKECARCSTHARDEAELFIERHTGVSGASTAANGGSPCRTPLKLAYALRAAPLLVDAGVIGLALNEAYWWTSQWKREQELEHSRARFLKLWRKVRIREAGGTDVDWEAFARFWLEDSNLETSDLTRSFFRKNAPASDPGCTGGVPTPDRCGIPLALALRKSWETRIAELPPDSEATRGEILDQIFGLPRQTSVSQ